MTDYGEVITDDESGGGVEDNMPSLVEDSEVELEAEGKSLVARPVLSAQAKVDDMDQQRENIFHTRCLVKDKLCSLIIDSWSCTNVASTILVEKLGLPTLKHPHPYKLQWLNDCGEVRVTKQVLLISRFGGLVRK